MIELANIINATKKAIEGFEEQQTLIDIEISERCLVHWFAIQFDDAIKKEFKQLGIKQELFSTDVEYNRFDKDVKRRVKHKSGDVKPATIDMVFHQRRETSIDGCILCVEAKTGWNNNLNTEEDRLSVKNMVKGEIDAIPHYQYGLIIVFDKEYAHCEFYSHKNPDHTQIEHFTYISHVNHLYLQCNAIHRI